MNIEGRKGMRLRVIFGTVVFIHICGFAFLQILRFLANVCIFCAVFFQTLLTPPLIYVNTSLSAQATLNFPPSSEYSEVYVPTTKRFLCNKIILF